MNRTVAALLLALLATGCDVQPYGGRCETNRDCDPRPLGEATATCLSTRIPGMACASANSMDCVCCPIDESMRATASPLCGVAPPADSGVTDTGVTDTGVVDTGVVDTGVADAGDAGDSGACPMTCPAGSFCQGGMCRPQLAIGVTCGGGTECQTGFCVSGVCCNSACTCAGCSCNAEADFRGLCTRVSTSMDAGATD